MKYAESPPKDLLGPRSDQLRELAAVNPTPASPPKSNGPFRLRIVSFTLKPHTSTDSRPIPLWQTRGLAPETRSVPSSSANRIQDTGDRQWAIPEVKHGTFQDSELAQRTTDVSSRLSHSSRSGPRELGSASNSSKPNNEKLALQIPTAELKAIYKLPIAENLIRLIFLQDLAGYWIFSKYLPALLNICTSFFFLFNADPTNPDRRKVWITLYVVRGLELVAVEEGVGC
ncbi:hypothetical protein ABVK25_009716 [Lepraria finkii]|uniref:Uncharacterized protein n=1 Tax=Lepraria finkii TaxID=1340010 RepID=A0ABR4AWR0_9LECA